MKTWGAGLLALWVLSLPVLTHVRAYDWQDERTLWRLASHAAPQKPRPLLNLGRLYHLEGYAWTASTYYRQALLVSAGRPSHERRIGCVVATRNLALLAQQQAEWAAFEHWSGYRCA